MPCPCYYVLCSSFIIETQQIYIMYIVYRKTFILSESKLSWYSNNCHLGSIKMYVHV